MKFSHRETPSGVNNSYFTTDITGKPLNLKHPDVNMNVYRKVKISNKQKKMLYHLQREKEDKKKHHIF